MNTFVRHRLPLAMLGVIVLQVSVSKAQDVTVATRTDAIIFGRDIAPVLVANCLECHNDQRKSSGLSMTTMAMLTAGGDSGATIEPGKPDASLIVRKIRGEDPPRMPRNRPPLTDGTIAAVAAWVVAGAKLDEGQNAESTLESLAWSPRRIAADRISRLSVADREKAEREELTRLMGRARSATSEADSRTIRTSKRFAVIGIDEANLADSVLESLEHASDTLEKLLGDRVEILGDEAGRRLVAVFSKPAEFAEFCRQNGFESRLYEDPVVAKTDGAWPILGILVSPDGLKATKANDATARPSAGKSPRRKGSARKESTGPPVRGICGLAVEALALAAFESFPKAPGWLKTGVALTTASALGDPEEASFDALRAEARSTGPGKPTGDWPRRAEDFLKDRLPPRVSRPLAFSLMDWLERTQPRAYAEFVRALTAGETALDKTIADLWKIDRTNFIAQWTTSLLRGSTRKGR